MADICHALIIDASLDNAFATAATPTGMEAWWTATSRGNPAEGATYELVFKRGYDWRGIVTQFAAPHRFELKITEADEDWIGSLISIELARRDDRTHIRFRHQTNWNTDSEQYAVSNYCWAQYLRAMKHSLERGERIPYEKRT